MKRPLVATEASYAHYVNMLTAIDFRVATYQALSHVGEGVDQPPTSPTLTLFPVLLVFLVRSRATGGRALFRLLGSPGAPKSDCGGSGVTARAQHLYPRVSQRAQNRLSAALSSCAFPLRARTPHRLLSFRRAFGFAFGNLVLACLQKLQHSSSCDSLPAESSSSCSFHRSHVQGFAAFDP